ncbi:hypothetical protein X975_23479, partial [Stegodyphus mimosarum]
MKLQLHNQTYILRKKKKQQVIITFKIGTDFSLQQEFPTLFLHRHLLKELCFFTHPLKFLSMIYTYNRIQTTVHD